MPEKDVLFSFSGMTLYDSNEIKRSFSDVHGERHRKQEDEWPMLLPLVIENQFYLLPINKKRRFYLVAINKIHIFAPKLIT